MFSLKNKKLPVFPRANYGKKTKRITFACSNEFKEFIDLFCKATSTAVSELCHRYVLEGMRIDLANMFIKHPHLDPDLRDTLEKSLMKPSL